jgi:hypothetical protein
METLIDIASQSDGVRCDMAMLMLSEIFEKTWGSRAGPRPATEYWTDIVSGVRAAYPGFLLIAEAYWDLEYRLRDLGFDYCYDKRLYDRLVHDDAERLREHLTSSPGWQRGLIRFLENHDEPRAASAFPPDRHRAAAIVMTTVPGAKLFFEGQFTGRRVKLPVQLGRAPEERGDPALAEFYAAVVAAARCLPFASGTWTLRDMTGWPDNLSCRNLLCWTWDDDWAIVVNFAPVSSQGLVQEVLQPGATWHLTDLFSGQSYDRPGGEPLYVELPPWGYYFWTITRL